MMKNKIPVVFFVYFLLTASAMYGQEDKPLTIKKEDSISKENKKTGGSRYDSLSKAHSPRKAALRSAILPGWGQIYNKKYWKLPIVYGAMGTCAGIFIYNLGNYKDTKFAYRVKYNMRVYKTDSTLFASIKDKLKPLSEESLKFYRNQFRRDIDYSALVFILLWGLNVVDATVDAHLKSFDITPDLSLRLKPGYSDLARTNGLSLILHIGK
ncbi:MAG TPA: DUF5683 domain-containing protein [Chitinophagaceae bacterium]|nr:DUF5683 domain-containing protein [Chitinophagaceae bacterium]